MLSKWANFNGELELFQAVLVTQDTLAKVE